MTTDAYEESNFEDLLLSDDFYSSNTSSNRMSSFRDSIYLKNSLSPALDHRESGEIEKTNVMKNSPSMKALEKILNEKSKNRYENSGNVIVEEDEEEEIKDPSVMIKEVKNRLSMISKDGTDNVNSISKDSESSGQYSDARTHTTESDSTFSTREVNEDVFDTVDGAYANGFHYNREKVNDYSSYAPELGYTKSKTADDQEDTLIEENFPNMKTETTKFEQENPKINSIPQKYTHKTSSMIPDDIKVSTKPIVSKEKDLPPINKKIGQSQTQTEEMPSPRHVRSNSTFTLSFKKEKEEKPSTRHKRSSTLGDLTAVNNTPQDTTSTKEKKKFSFKSLFKTKSKARINERLHQDEYSEPKKLSAKSFSTPSISKFNNSTSASVSESFKPQVNNNEYKLRESNGGEKIPRENTLLNVFKKNKSVEGFSSTERNEDKERKKINRMSTWIDNNFVNATKPSDVKSMSEVNLIREVNDTVESEYAYSQKEDDDYDTKNLTFDPPTKINNTRIGEEMELLPNPSPDIKFDDKPYSLESESPKKEDQILKVPESSKELHDVSNNSTKEISDNPDTKINNQLLGEALFPKSLNQLEVESIVSLERSRSIRSIKSNKRNSFINYNGSDENIIVYSGEVSTPSKGISRSGSILKNSKLSLNVNDESHIMNIDDTLDTKIGTKDDTKTDHKVDHKADQMNINPGPINNTDNEDMFGNYEEFMEFSDFIDLDNLSFSTSPKQLILNRDNEIDIDTPDKVDPSLIATSDDLLNVEDDTHTSNISTQQEQHDQSNINEPILANTPLTPNLEVIDSTKLPTSPESPEVDRATSDTGFNNSPILNERGNNILNNRPISMSFKGLRGPSFGNTLAQHDIRNSDSHQSFNLSFGEDDTDYSSSVVGGGFGTSDEDDEDDYSDFSTENKENQCNSNNQRFLPQPNKKFGSKNNDNISSTLTPPKNFKHNKMPSFSDASNLSSPISVSSVSSRRGYNTSRSPINARFIKDLGNEVRFSSRIILYDTYSCDEYDRHPDTGTCNQLTPLLAQQIREELNELKRSMPVHEDSQCFTHFL